MNAFSSDIDVPSSAVIQATCLQNGVQIYLITVSLMTSRSRLSSSIYRLIRYRRLLIAVIRLLTTNSIFGWPHRQTIAFGSRYAITAVWLSAAPRNLESRVDLHWRMFIDQEQTAMSRSGSDYDSQPKRKALSYKQEDALSGSISVKLDDNRFE